MGERGPPPKYTDEQRMALGNPGNRKLPTIPGNEAAEEPVSFPDVLTDVPAAPEWLYGKSADNGAMAVNAWNAVAPVLVAARTFREGDQVALARYCRYVAEWVALTDEIDDRGFIITNSGPKGGETTIANPAIRARGLVETGLSALERELGLSPKARVEVQKRLMGALKDLPINAGNKTQKQRNGPIGALLADDEDDE